ncbi:MAG: PE-PGRS family protein [Myxococcales bacterium]|nr:PE-PGRS family protein [Myxococcales bacterium]
MRDVARSRHRSPIPRRVGAGLAAGLAAAMLVLPVHAGDVNVSDAASLVTAIGAAKAGDTIILANGDYALSGVSCSASGTELAPIVVKGATPLGAHISFDALEGFKVAGAHWHFEGLDISGVCAVDDNCEHAFHVVGKAVGFRLRSSRVRDFNAQLKVNAAQNGNGWDSPDGGVVEYCDIGDTKPRVTGNPVSKLNINNANDWVVRGSVIHDFHKNGGNGVSYGAFMKGGGHGGLFERNLVLCSQDVATGGTRLGLSFGGGGTGNQFCAPAYDANVPCSIEHDGGTLRNNLIMACSDVGVYVNRGKNTRLLHNTIINTAGVDYRFDTSSGASVNNLTMGKIRDRDGATHTSTGDLTEQPLSFFTALYANPSALDFAVVGDAAGLAVGASSPDVTDDYCARPRPNANLAIGALEHSLGDCKVFPPPQAVPSGAGGAGGADGNSGAGGAHGNSGAGGNGLGATAVGSGAGGNGAGGNGAADNGAGDNGAGSGCGCRIESRSRPRHGALLAALLAAIFLARSRRVRDERRARHCVATRLML